VLSSLKQAFPNTRINAEYYVNYRGQKLFFDFHIPTLNIVIEVQGVQHTEFNKHFHGTAENFKAQKKRDKIKIEWCHLEDLALVCVHHNEIPIEVSDLLKKIEDAQHGPEN
jgi:very-short-patch-repair endonuclease